MTRRRLALSAALTTGAVTALLIATATPAVPTAERTPSIDRFFDLEPVSPLTRESAVALANEPPTADQAAYNFAALRAQAALPVASANLPWKQLGPTAGLKEDADHLVSGRLPGTGITLSLAADPRDTTGGTLYVGSGGGLWKTTNAGTTWKRMNLPSVPVGGVGVDPGNPDIVVAATGQAFQGGGEGGGLGAYVSRDAGKTWTRPAKNVTGNGGQQVDISPNGTVLVATDRGLYVSTDHGASFTDTRLPTNAAGTAPATGTPVGSWTSDVKVRPGHPNEVWAAVGYVAGNVTLADGTKAAPGNGLYRSKAGGAPGTFSRVDVSSRATGWNQNPTGSSDPIGRVKLAFSPDGGRLYALVADAGLRSSRSVADQAIPLGLGHDTSLNGIYLSESLDDEATAPVWYLKATSETLTAAPGSAQPVLSAASQLGYQPGIQAWYNGWIAVDPVTPTRLFVGEEETYAAVANSTGPGPMAMKVIDRYVSPCSLATNGACADGTPLFGGVSTHPDQHAGLPVKAGAVTRLWSGNDGGTFRQDSHATTDQVGFDNEGWTSTAHYNTLLPYRAVKGSDGSVVAGLQDNGTVYYAPGGAVGIEICGGDGSGVATAPEHPATFYCQANGSLSVTTNAGRSTSDTGAPAAPAFQPAAFLMDPANEKHLLIADTSLYETTAGSSASGSSDWTSVFTTPNGGTIEAVDAYGANAYAAYCLVCASSVKASITSLDRALATNVKPGCEPKEKSASCWHVAALKGMPKREIVALAVDPVAPKNVYLALNAPSVVKVDFGDPARVVMSTDAGETVKDVSGNLPQGNVYDVKVAGKNVYAATDLGVFVAAKGTSSWKRLGSNLPIGRVYGLSISADRTEIVASTYGSGVWVQKLAGGRTVLPPVTTVGPPRTGGTGKGALAATGLPVGLAGLGAVVLLGLSLQRRRRGVNADELG